MNVTTGWTETFEGCFQSLGHNFVSLLDCAISCCKPEEFFHIIEEILQQMCSFIMFYMYFNNEVKT
jgi:hypothetical protein